jgi:hypothetical protein
MIRFIGLSAASFLLVVAVGSPGSAQNLIVDSADTHALWHFEQIEPNLTVQDLIFGGSFTSSEAILDDDSSFPRAPYQDLLLGAVFGQFPSHTHPTLTTGGGGVIGEALDFSGAQQEAIAILGWLGDGDDGTGNVNEANSLDTMYTDFWFREREHDGTQVMVSATSTWEVRLATDAVAFTAWDSNFGNNTISIDLDQFGADGAPDSKWRHAVAFVDESGTQSLTVDDITVTGTLNGTVKPQKKSITLGNKENQARWFNGLLDEVYVGFVPPSFGTPGDFDVDGDVDGHDFLEWQHTDGTPGGLADWQDNYPSPLSAVTSVTSVPEPSTLCLAFILSIASLHRRG